MEVEVGGVVRLVDESMDDELLEVLIFLVATVSVSGSLASSCSCDTRACARFGAPRLGEGDLDLEKGSGTVIAAGAGLLGFAGGRVEGEPSDGRVRSAFFSAASFSFLFFSSACAVSRMMVARRNCSS